MFSAPETCPTLSAALHVDLVNGKQYHRSPGKLLFKYARSYCAQLGLKPASVATEDDFRGVLAYIGEIFLEISVHALLKQKF